MFEHNREVYCCEECRDAGYNFKRRMRRRKKPEDKIKDCAYCGQPFIYEHNREIYCCPRCQKHGYQDKDNARQKRYHKMYKWLINPKNLGTVSLGTKPQKDPAKEREKIEQERKRIGLKNKMFSTSAGTLSLFLQFLGDTGPDRAVLLLGCLVLAGGAMVWPWLWEWILHWVEHHIS